MRTTRTPRLFARSHVGTWDLGPIFAVRARTMRTRRPHRSLRLSSLLALEPRYAGLADKGLARERASQRGQCAGSLMCPCGASLNINPISSLRQAGERPTGRRAPSIIHGAKHSQQVAEEQSAKSEHRT